MNFNQKIGNIIFEETGGQYKVECDDTFTEQHYDVLKSLPNLEFEKLMIRAGLINDCSNCENYGDLLTKIYRVGGRHPFFRCGKRTCSNKRSKVFKNSIFDEIKISLQDVVKILLYFSSRRVVSDAAENLNISKPTIISFYKLFRVTLCYFVDHFSARIGGPGVVVHFDETSITRRHKGIGNVQCSNTVWVVDGVDIYTRRCFFKFLPSRSREDLYRFFNELILPGSTVHTDCHRSYATLQSLGFNHFTVNHSRYLVGPDGIHTNWIEGMFGCVKKMMRKYDTRFRDVETLEHYLKEFIFRYCYEGWDKKKAFLKIAFVFKKVRSLSNNS